MDYLPAPYEGQAWQIPATSSLPVPIPPSHLTDPTLGALARVIAHINPTHVMADRRAKAFISRTCVEALTQAEVEAQRRGGRIVDVDAQQIMVALKLLTHGPDPQRGHIPYADQVVSLRSDAAHLLAVRVLGF